ncbi:hypothetical protein FACS1894203_3850 [Bacteroidia bacterium]|nr:hypothetical protein FACS1894203_3850 [Bacteroidia bacterium]GHU91217.1 hypothetical protein FACS1894155_10620 [Bacteroidia bacterium]
MSHPVLFDLATFKHNWGQRYKYYFEPPKIFSTLIEIYLSRVSKGKWQGKGREDKPVKTHPVRKPGSLTHKKMIFLIRNV